MTQPGGGCLELMVRRECGTCVFVQIQVFAFVLVHVFTHVRARVGVRAVVCTCVQMGHASGVGEGGACSGVDMWHKGPGL